MSAQLSPCGTYAAGRRHYRHGEPLDDACREAVAEHNRRRSDGNDCERCGRPRKARVRKSGPWAGTTHLEGAGGLCDMCYTADRRAKPATAPRRSLKASDSGYGPLGVVPLDVAS
jgi:hypothetical protein